jgi:PAS domain S-box-containing protein
MTSVFTKMFSKVYQKNRLDEASDEIDNLEIALNASSLVTITDLKGNITFVNQKFCNLSKYSKDELIGKNHKILKSDYHSSEFFIHLWYTISNGKIWHGSIKNKAKDNSFYWIKTTIIPFFKSGKITKYVSICQDVTDEINLSQKMSSSEKFSTVGEFTSRLAHDLRNPLSIIQITLENFKMLYDVDEKKQIQFAKVERSIERMAHQIDEVLDYVKEKPLNLRNVSFSEILKNTLDSFKIPFDIKIILPKHDVILNCDGRQLVIVFSNLILNAIHAINGKGLIVIGLEEKNDEIIIEIEDSGKGISKKDLHHVFDPLFTTKQHGTGLGLVSVKSIISSHGGLISVMSQPTIFRISLPKNRE